MDNKCKCGCGEPVTNDFVKGHYAKYMLRKKALHSAFFVTDNHPDCLSLNPETKCKRCLVRKKLNERLNND